MNFEELFARRANHVLPGLERIRKSFESLGRPAEKIPSVLIGGTNGKGSTSGFIWSLLALSRRNIGLYSSPHLFEFSERFQLSQKTVSDDDVSGVYHRFIRDLPKEREAELSFFEIATLLGFRLFEEEKVDFAVLEVGLGGRYDATNISDPHASVVVSVSLDHKEFLGTDLLGILKEKFAIGRRGRPLFWGAQGEVMQEAGLDDAIKESLAETGAILYTRGREFWATEQKVQVRLPGREELELSLEGIFAGIPDYLRQNLSIAAAYYHWLQGVHPELPTLSSIWSKFCLGEQRSAVTLVGRAQRLKAKDGSDRKFLIDVCHNPDGARAFASAVRSRFPERTIPAFVCILKDKDTGSILDILRSVLSPVILFGIESERSWDQTSLAARHQGLPFYPTLEAALASELSQSRADEPWAICGSVAAVGHALQILKVLPKELTLASIIRGDWSDTPDPS